VTTARRWRYRAPVLEELARHGIRPTETTPPRAARDYVSDLYRYEIRRLKRRLLGGEFPRTDYNRRVVQLRLRYPLLSVPLERWTE
jgi:hypothetical protein